MQRETNITLRPNIQILPAARLNPAEAAKLLGFQEHDIPVLIAKKLLKPLGKPKPNAQKYFSWIQVISCLHDDEWLSKATQAIYDHWHGKNSRKRNRLPKDAYAAPLSP